MSSSDKDTNLSELKELVAKFRDERGWAKHHSPKNLSISIAIEAAELMELFQWDDYSKSDRRKITDELADILIYCFNLADTLDIDVSKSFKDKLERAAKKYPVEIFNPDHDDLEDYDRIKKEYRRKS